MTRKQYIHKLWTLTLAIYNSPDSIFPAWYKVGEAMKHNKEFAKKVPATFGSYEAAWNSDHARWARDHYGVN